MTIKDEIRRKKHIMDQSISFLYITNILMQVSFMTDEFNVFHDIWNSNFDRTYDD